MVRASHEDDNHFPINLVNVVGPIPCDEYNVFEWCPLPDGQGRAEAVVISMEVPMGTVLMRIKTRRALDELISTLKKHGDNVWGGHQ